MMVNIGEYITSELNTSLYSPRNAASIVPKLWVFLPKGYGLWIIEDLWVMVCKSLPTELVDRKSYGISGFMGYLSHGLRGCRLYLCPQSITYETNRGELGGFFTLLT